MVSDLANVETRLAGEKRVMARRTAFYGMDESAYAGPCGNIAMFAQRAGPSPGGCGGRGCSQ